MKKLTIYSSDLKHINSKNYYATNEILEKSLTLIDTFTDLKVKIDLLPDNLATISIPLNDKYLVANYFKYEDENLKLYFYLDKKTYQNNQKYIYCNCVLDIWSSYVEDFNKFINHEQKVYVGQSNILPTIQPQPVKKSILILDGFNYTFDPIGKIENVIEIKQPFTPTYDNYFIHANKLYWMVTVDLNIWNIWVYDYLTQIWKQLNNLPTGMDGTKLSVFINDNKIYGLYANNAGDVYLYDIVINDSGLVFNKYENFFFNSWSGNIYGLRPNDFTYNDLSGNWSGFINGVGDDGTPDKLYNRIWYDSQQTKWFASSFSWTQFENNYFNFLYYIDENYWTTIGQYITRDEPPNMYSTWYFYEKNEHLVLQTNFNKKYSRLCGQYKDYIYFRVDEQNPKPMSLYIYTKNNEIVKLATPNYRGPMNYITDGYINTYPQTNLYDIIGMKNIPDELQKYTQNKVVGFHAYLKSIGDDVDDDKKVTSIDVGTSYTPPVIDYANQNTYLYSIIKPATDVVDKPPNPNFSKITDNFFAIMPLTKTPIINPNEAPNLATMDWITANYSYGTSPNLLNIIGLPFTMPQIYKIMNNNNSQLTSGVLHWILDRTPAAMGINQSVSCFFIPSFIGTDTFYLTTTPDQSDIKTKKWSYQQILNAANINPDENIYINLFISENITMGANNNLTYDWVNKYNNNLFIVDNIYLNFSLYWEGSSVSILFNNYNLVKNINTDIFSENALFTNPTLNTLTANSMTASLSSSYQTWLQQNAPSSNTSRLTGDITGGLAIAGAAMGYALAPETFGLSAILATFAALYGGMTIANNEKSYQNKITELKQSSSNLACSPSVMGTYFKQFGPASITYNVMVPTQKGIEEINQYYINYGAIIDLWMTFDEINKYPKATTDFSYYKINNIDAAFKATNFDLNVKNTILNLFINGVRIWNVPIKFTT